MTGERKPYSYSSANHKLVWNIIDINRVKACSGKLRQQKIWISTWIQQKLFALKNLMHNSLQVHTSYFLMQSIVIIDSWNLLLGVRVTILLQFMNSSNLSVLNSSLLSESRGHVLITCQKSHLLSRQPLDCLIP